MRHCIVLWQRFLATFSVSAIPNSGERNSESRVTAIPKKQQFSGECNSEFNFLFSFIFNTILVVINIF